MHHNFLPSDLWIILHNQFTKLCQLSKWMKTPNHVALYHQSWNHIQTYLSSIFCALVVLNLQLTATLILSFQTYIQCFQDTYLCCLVQLVTSNGICAWFTNHLGVRRILSKSSDWSITLQKSNTVMICCTVSSIMDSYPRDNSETTWGVSFKMFRLGQRVIWHLCLVLQR